MIELSIIIPAFNEGKVIQENINKVKVYLNALHINYEIIIVNDGSQDNTLVLAKSLEGDNCQLITYPQNKGKGYAVNQGMKKARGRFCLFMDMDLATDLTEIPVFLLHMKTTACDICVGNRYHIALLQQRRPWLRACLGKVFTLLSVWASGCKLADFTCGFKMYTAEAAGKIFLLQTIYNWAFDTELIAIANSLRLRIDHLPVKWEHRDNSKVRIASAMGSSLVTLFKIWRLRKVGGGYGHNGRV